MDIQIYEKLLDGLPRFMLLLVVGCLLIGGAVGAGIVFLFF